MGPSLTSQRSLSHLQPSALPPGPAQPPPSPNQGCESSSRDLGKTQRPPLKSSPLPSGRPGVLRPLPSRSQQGSSSRAQGPSRQGRRPSRTCLTWACRPGAQGLACRYFWLPLGPPVCHLCPRLVATTSGRPRRSKCCWGGPPVCLPSHTGPGLCFSFSDPEINSPEGEKIFLQLLMDSIFFFLICAMINSKYSCSLVICLLILFSSQSSTLL